jgi:hypothetical protein
MIARMIQKRGNGAPTIPRTNDNTDGTWLPTDLFDGELYIDLDTDKLYLRIGIHIYEITMTITTHS